MIERVISWSMHNRFFCLAEYPIHSVMAYINLTGAKIKTLTVPKSALVFSEDTAMWVETATDQFEMRLVKTGCKCSKG